MKLDVLIIDYEKLFNKIQSKTISDTSAEKQYYDAQAEFVKLFKFNDDIIFDVSKQSDIEKKATAYNLNYFKTHYGVDLK